MSLKDGVQQSKAQEQLTVSKPKPKPNALADNSKVQRGGGGGGSSQVSKESSPVPPASAGDMNSGGPTQIVTVQDPRIEELLEELKKMKAVILKHEVRIRDLERQTATAAAANGSAHTNGESHVMHVEDS